MATISTNTTCAVSFTDEEKKILQKASEICKNAGQEAWRMDTERMKKMKHPFSFSKLVKELKIS